jgi:hypothetical protein
MLKRFTTTAAYTALAFTTSTLLPLAASADLCPRQEKKSGTDFSTVCKLGFNDSTFGNIITIVFIFAILLALGYLIWGGIKWVLSGGDKAKVDAARSAIVAAIVGLVIVFLAYFIINIVVPIFVPGFSLQTIQLPSINQQ